MYFSKFSNRSCSKSPRVVGLICSALCILLLSSIEVHAQEPVVADVTGNDLSIRGTEKLPALGITRPAPPTAEYFNPYDGEQFNFYLQEGLRLQEANKHEAAVTALEKAWRINRMERGLYHEEQIPILKSIVYSQLEAGNYSAVESQYDYLTYLYKRLYPLEDPRLEAGLQQISSFHINAFNVNLEGRQEHHLRKAAVLLELRYDAALATLDKGHPKLQYLEQSIELSKQHLYLLSDRYRELRAGEAKRNRERLFAALE